MHSHKLNKFKLGDQWWTKDSLENKFYFGKQYLRNKMNNKVNQWINRLQPPTIIIEIIDTEPQQNV